MDLLEVRRAVGKMKTALFKNSNSYSTGMLKSHFKGLGLTYKDHQIYCFGDDTRFIDWKLLAKTRHPYIKVFEEERNVEITVVLDASLSMFSGYGRVSKLEAAIELTCLLYLLAHETKDFITVLLVSDEIIHVHKKSGEEGMAVFLNMLAKKNILNNDGKLNLGFQFKKILSDEEKRKAIMKYLFKKRELVIFSDFNEFMGVKDLKKILYQKKTHPFRIVSPLDESKELSYLLSVKTSPLGPQASQGKVFGGLEQDKVSLFHKRVKELKVHARYLEDFIKEMM